MFERHSVRRNAQRMFIVIATFFGELSVQGVSIALQWEVFSSPLTRSSLDSHDWTSHSCSVSSFLTYRSRQGRRSPGRVIAGFGL